MCKMFLFFSSLSCCYGDCDFEHNGNVAVCQCMVDTRLQVRKIREVGDTKGRWRRETKLS